MSCKSEGFIKIDNTISGDFIEKISHNIKNENKEKYTAIIITGATGSGKSNFAFTLAKEIGGLIINADSRQIYKQIPIITAQPTETEKQEIQHFLYGFKDITQLEKLYSVGDYVIDLEKIIIEVKDKYSNKIPIIVGGSMLYINTLLNGIDSIPEIPANISSNIREKYNNVSTDMIFDDLKKIDEKYAKIVDKNNPKRIIRGIEVAISTGKSIVEFWSDNKGEKNTIVTKYFSNIKKYIITLPRDVLYDRINKRADLMVKNGCIEEVRNLYDYCLNNGIDITKLPKTIGIQELFAYFKGKISVKTTIEKIKQMSRNYAKRQMTWWR